MVVIITCNNTALAEVNAWHGLYYYKLTKTTKS